MPEMSSLLLLLFLCYDCTGQIISFLCEMGQSQSLSKQQLIMHSVFLEAERAKLFSQPSDLVNQCSSHLITMIPRVLNQM